MCAVKNLPAVSRFYRDDYRANPHAISVGHPDRHDYFSQLLPHSGLCRASQAGPRVFPQIGSSGWPVEAMLSKSLYVAS
jgi:hypothetical protein